MFWVQYLSQLSSIINLYSSTSIVLNLKQYIYSSFFLIIYYHKNSCDHAIIIISSRSNSSTNLTSAGLKSKVKDDLFKTCNQTGRQLIHPDNRIHGSEITCEILIYLH